MKIYFSTTAWADEVAALRKVKPENLLISYFYFKNRPLKPFVELLGYKPKILLDSGAYSASTRGKNISLIDYMAYIEANKEYIEHYFTLDVIGDELITYHYYQIMKLKGFNPIPVYHYGDSEEVLIRYIDNGFIGLGGTVPIKDKNKVAEWVKDIIQRYPGVKFHLLGSSSEKITSIPGLYSCDSSTWIMQAKNGRPKHIKGKDKTAKIARAVFNLQSIGGLA